MKVFDLFPFYNELALLELRLAELGRLNCYHGLVELPRTFTDLPKPLYFTESGFVDRPVMPSVHVHIPGAYPSGPHPTIDWFQRRETAAFISDAAPDDIVMLSDVDEIPNRDVVREVIAAGYDHPVVLDMRLYYHRVDLYDPLPWQGTIIAPRKCLGERPDMQELRNQRCNLPRIPNGGWHFSWLGDWEAIKEKLQAVDIERDSDNQMHHPSEDPKFLQNCYETGFDLFSRPDHHKIEVPIIPGVNQPHEIETWLAKYPQYAKDKAVR